jgi:hypothetical protein
MPVNVALGLYMQKSELKPAFWMELEKSFLVMKVLLFTSFW